MKKILLCLSLLLLIAIVINVNTYAATASGNQIAISKQNFPDKNLRKYVKKYDLNKDGKLSKNERKKVKTLYIMSDTFKVSRIKNFNCKGLQYFYNLKNLSIDVESRKNKIKNVKYVFKLKNIKKLTLAGKLDERKLDFKKMKHLKNLTLFETNIKSVNVKKNTGIKYINISRNYYMKKLDLSKNTKLKKIRCYQNRISKLNLPKSESIIELNVSCNALKEILVGSLKNIEKIDISTTFITSIDVSKNSKLKQLTANEDTEILKGKDQTFEYITDDFTYYDYLEECY